MTPDSLYSHRSLMSELDGYMDVIRIKQTYLNKYLKLYNSACGLV